MKKLSGKQKVIIGVVAAVLLVGAALFSVVKDLTSSKQTPAATAAGHVPPAPVQDQMPAQDQTPVQDQTPAAAGDDSSLSHEEACDKVLSHLDRGTYAYVEELTLLDLTEDPDRGTAVAHFAPILQSHQIGGYGTLTESAAITATYTYSEDRGWRLYYEDLDWDYDRVYDFAGAATILFDNATQLSFDLTITDNTPAIQNIRYTAADGSEGTFSISNLACTYSSFSNSVEVTFDYTRGGVPGHENEEFGAATSGSGTVFLGVDAINDVWMCSAAFSGFRFKEHNGSFLDYSTNDLVFTGL